MSMTNWFFSESARAWASSRLVASPFSTAYSGAPLLAYVSFIATNAAAIPAAVLKNFRRLMPCCFASFAPRALTRASNSRCFVRSARRA